MSARISTKYRNLAISTAIAVYLLIVIGGTVRVSGSGLGCPDWPTCFGSILPPNAERIESLPEGQALISVMGGIEAAVTAARIEYSHRIIASLGGVLILLTIIGAWMNYRSEKWIFIPANLVIGLMLIQVPLGGIVVLTELEPLLVGIHLGIAFLIFASILIITVYTLRPHVNNEPSDMILASRKIWLATAFALFIALMFAAAVVGSNTGLACPDWPFCNNAAGVIFYVPSNYSPTIWFHLLHRYTILLYSILLAWALWKTWRESENLGAIRWWSVILAGLFIGQITLGAIQVWLDKPPVLRIFHLALASLVWMALVILILLHYLGKPTPEIVADTHSS
jgi:heme A synthase